MGSVGDCRRPALTSHRSAARPGLPSAEDHGSCYDDDGGHSS